VSDMRRQHQGKAATGNKRTTRLANAAVRKHRQHSHVDELLGDNEPVVADEGLAGGADALLAVGGEGDVGAARVLAAEGPLRLAVADDEDARGAAAHGWLLLAAATKRGRRFGVSDPSGAGWVSECVSE